MARGVLFSRDRDAPAAALGVAERRCPLAAGEGDCRAETARGVLVANDSDVPAVALCAAARRAPPPARRGEGDSRARTARGVLVSRDRDAPVAALGAAARRGPPPARLGRATAKSRRHVVCSGSSRANAVRERRTRCSHECEHPSALLGGGYCGARMAPGVLFSRDCDAPAAERLARSRCASCSCSAAAPAAERDRACRPGLPGRERDRACCTDRVQRRSSVQLEEPRPRRTEFST
jgi:hypothetical protein